MIKEFGDDFGLPFKKQTKHLRFDTEKNTFAVDNARERFEFFEKVKEHKHQQSVLLATIEKADKRHQPTTFDVENENDSDEEPEQLTGEKTHLGSLKEKWVTMDKEFETLYSQLCERSKLAVYDSDKNALVRYLNATTDKWSKAKDLLLRGIVHRAAEDGNLKLLS